jgi:hypothetical protein
MKYRIEDSDVIRLEADVNDGWHRLTNTYGFCEQILADEIGLQVQVAIRAWPNRIGQDADKLPRDATAYFRHVADNNPSLISYRLGGGVFELRLGISECKKSVLPRSRRRGVYLEPRKIWGPQELKLWFSTLAYFVDRESIEHPDIREFDTQFYSGGLPGTARGH